MKKFTVDRIEGNKVVLVGDNGVSVNLDLSSIPKNTRKKLKDGDVLRFEDNSCFLDRRETADRKKRIEALMREVFKD